MSNETQEIRSQVKAYLQSAASMKGLIREMDAHELAALKETIEDPTLISYIDEQLRQLASK
jgi:hypothetical protein